MGHVINPISFRLGYSRYWNSVWSLSNLSNYAQLTTLDSLILKVSIAYFRKIFYSKALRFIILLNSCKILRKRNSTKIIMQVYDAVSERNRRTLLLKLKRSFFRWRIFQCSKWKRVNWIARPTKQLQRYRLGLVLSIHNITGSLRRSFSKSRHINAKVFTAFSYFLDKDVEFYPVNLRIFAQYTNTLYSKGFSKLKLLKHSSNLVSNSLFKVRPSMFISDANANNGLLTQHRRFFVRQEQYKRRRLRLAVLHYYFSRYFIFKFRQLLINFWWQLKINLALLIAPLVPGLLPHNIVVVGLNDLTVDASFISNFIAYHLTNRYYLFQILKVLWRVLNRYIRKRILYGYQVKLSGRFRKNEKAVYLTRKLGSIGRYDIKRYVDYSFATARMRLGVTGIKVWMSYSSGVDMLIKTKVKALSNSAAASFWVDCNLSKQPISIPLRVLRSSVLRKRCTWVDSLKNLNKNYLLLKQVAMRKSKFISARYSYIY